MKSVVRAMAYLLSATCAWQCAVAPAFAQDAEPSATPAQVSPIAFPREVAGETGTVVVHTPQIDTWTDFESIEARVAVEVTPAGEEEPVYGVAEFTADTDPNLELRIVAVENTKITVTSFPVEDDARREHLDSIVRTTIQPQTQYVPLDVILSYIAPNAKPAEVEGLSFDPPPIFYSSTPAILVITDGEPLLAPIPDRSPASSAYCC